MGGQTTPPFASMHPSAGAILRGMRGTTQIASVMLVAMGLVAIGACSGDDAPFAGTLSPPDGGTASRDGDAGSDGGEPPRDYDSGIPGVTIDPGKSVTAAIKAAEGGSMTLPDGARLDIPPGALPRDLTITVRIPTKQSADSTSFTYVIEPPGVKLLAPATLTLTMNHFPTESDFVQAFLSSKVNPVVDVGREQTNWVVANATARDPDKRTMSFALPDFTALFAIISVDAEHRTYLVTDIPAAYLHRGDLLFTLTPFGAGPGW